MRSCVLVGVAIAALGLVSAPSDADACSCSASPTLVSPADAATAVPTNAIVIVQLDYDNGWSLELRSAATNEVVPVSTEVRPVLTRHGTTVFARPAAPLAPNTPYVVTVNVNGSPNGSPMSTSMFTTGETDDTLAPAFAGLRAMSPETLGYPVADSNGTTCLSTCIVAADNHVSRIRLDYDDPPDDVVHLAFRLYDANHVLIEEQPIWPNLRRKLGFDLCGPQSAILELGGAYCGRLVAYDVAGNVAGESAEVCTTTATCALRYKESPAGLCEPADECVPVESGCSTGHTTSAGSLVLIGLAMMLIRRRR